MAQVDRKSACGEFDDRQLAIIERTTQEIGRYLFDHLGAGQPTVLDRRWWDDRIMAWAMHDESVKVQMFRVIDVLPMLIYTEFTLAANFATSAALSVGLGLITWFILALARSFSGSTVAAAG